MSTLHRTIIRPVMTEKTSARYHERSEYTFEVAPDANKAAIRQAIERLFGVKVTGVWTANVRGKTRRVAKSAGRRPNWKKAIVQLREGDTIDVFEG
jgi:large subunit ribosomal protein L23